MKYGFGAFLLCAYKNRATFIGYLYILTWAMSFIAFVSTHPTKHEVIFLLATVGLAPSFPLLVLTGFGLDTYHTYKRTLRILEAHKTLPTTDRPYCNKVGILLAKDRYELALRKNSAKAF